MYCLFHVLYILCTVYFMYVIFYLSTVYFMYCLFQILYTLPAHICPSCGKKFSQKQWLKEHSQVHSEERPVFECPHDQCQREYLSQRNLNAHIKSYHNKQRFTCEEPGCGRTFATKVKE